MIPRGTTPNQIFNVDIDLTDAEVLYLTYKQGNVIVLEKEKDDLTITKDKVTFRMTQKESLVFETNNPVKIQIRARFPDGIEVETEGVITHPDGTAVKSNIVTTDTDYLLKEGVI